MARKINTVLPSREELNNLRKKCIEITVNSGGGHLGGAFSAAEIISVLYKNILKINPKKPNWPDRDRFILSKGHSCLSVFVTLSNLGFFPKKELELYCQPGGILPGHTTITIPGVEASTGSLGHGLSIGVGMAMAAKMDRKKWRVFVVVSDGDCEEGSTWEAIMAAGHRKLDNLIVIVDYNNLNSFEKVSETFNNFAPLKEKFESFGWGVLEIDGHNVNEIYNTLSQVPFKKDKPSVIVAKTIKGKGVSFMENNPPWHYKVPNPDEYELAMRELSVK